MSVTWKLKRGSSGTTVSRLLPTMSVRLEFASDPATAAVTIGSYKDVKVEKVDDHTVIVHFAAADAVLGGPVCRHTRHGHPQTPVC